MKIKIITKKNLQGVFDHSVGEFLAKIISHKSIENT